MFTKYWTSNRVLDFQVKRDTLMKTNFCLDFYVKKPHWWVIEFLYFQVKKATLMSNWVFVFPGEKSHVEWQIWKGMFLNASAAYIITLDANQIFQVLIINTKKKIVFLCITLCLRLRFSIPTFQTVHKAVSKLILVVF